MASHAHSTPAPTVRSAEAATEAPTRRRPAAAEGVPTVRPTIAGFYLAYLANGDLPPWPLADRLAFSFTASSGLLAVALSIWSVAL